VDERGEALPLRVLKAFGGKVESAVAMLDLLKKKVKSKVA